MYPILFEHGWLTIYSYGLLLALGYLGGLYLAIVRARSRGLDGALVMDLGIWIIVSALIGAKLMLLIVEWDMFSSDPAKLWGLLRSGGVFYGGLLLALIGAFTFMYVKKLPFWTTCDVFAPGIALGHVIGRLGCFLGGCCFGLPTTMPWGVTFESELAHQIALTPLGHPLHPTQLYEAGAELLILVFLLIRERRGGGFPGRTFWSYMLLYGVSRFVIEFYRGDFRGEKIFALLSPSQFIAVILVPLSIVMLIRLARQAPAPSGARALA